MASRLLGWSAAPVLALALAPVLTGCAAGSTQAGSTQANQTQANQTQANNTLEAPAPISPAANAAAITPEIWPELARAPLDPAIEAQITAIMAQMTLEQKVVVNHEVTAGKRRCTVCQ